MKIVRKICVSVVFAALISINILIKVDYSQDINVERSVWRSVRVP